MTETLLALSGLLGTRLAARKPYCAVLTRAIIASYLTLSRSCHHCLATHPIPALSLQRPSELRWCPDPCDIPTC